MAKVYRIADVRRQSRPTFFDRGELNQLLSLYSRRVASGEWRDYAIDQRGGSAVFSVFRHSHDAPLFRIAKRVNGNGPCGEYVVFSGGETLAQAASMSEALSIFGRGLRLIPRPPNRPEGWEPTTGRKNAGTPPPRIEPA